MVWGALEKVCELWEKASHSKNQVIFFHVVSYQVDRPGKMQEIP
jgi:hypothetical protein